MMRLYISIFIALLFAACGGSHSAASSEKLAANVQVPVFDADSALAYVKAQCAFGPRVPNSEAHRRCAQWLAAKLGSLGAENVVVDTFCVQAYNGQKLNSFNITAQVNPAASKRILLLSHWDSRPWADHDPDPSKHYSPIDGANDGASGVGVILETVRALAANYPKMGVDVLLVDAEDYGRHVTDEDIADEDSWALGSKHWMQNPTLDTQKVRFAILLDMVGGKDAVFPREYFSESAAKFAVDKVWKAAADAGHASRFVNEVGTPVMDDHVNLLQGGIAAIDIIETNHPQTGSFNPTWHTLSDNIENIDPATLKAVGETLLTLIYSQN